MDSANNQARYRGHQTLGYQISERTHMFISSSRIPGNSQLWSVGHDKESHGRNPLLRNWPGLYYIFATQSHRCKRTSLSINLPLTPTEKFSGDLHEKTR